MTDMKYQLTIFLLMVFACVCNAHTHAEFEGIELTGERKQFVYELIRKGYDCIHDAGSKSTLEGKYKRLPCSVIVHSYSRSIDIVYKVEVLTKNYTQWDELEAEFERLEDAISNIYGSPSNGSKTIFPPFEEEGNQMQAISMNCYNYFSTWNEDEDAKIRLGIKSNGCIEIRITDRQSESLGKKIQQNGIQNAVENTKEAIGNFFNTIKQ